MRKIQYLEIAKKIEYQIVSGKYSVGSALPSRPALASEFGVARGTVELAVEVLIKEKVLTSRHGSGTYVNEPAVAIRKIGVVDGGVFTLKERRGITFLNFHHDELKEKSKRRELASLNGIVWVHPESYVLNKYIPHFQGHVPQFVMNRVVDGINCISTDHTGAYREITLERLKRFPNATPYFLKVQQERVVSNYREKGFIDACRLQNRFYETLYLDEDFDEKMKILRETHFTEKRPLLLLADFDTHTGAVMAWAREKQLKWGRDIFYSDFDNNYGRHVWGVTVTSFIQNFQLLFDRAVDELELIFNGAPDLSKRILIAPERRNGGT